MEFCLNQMLCLTKTSVPYLQYASKGLTFYQCLEERYGVMFSKQTIPSKMKTYKRVERPLKASWGILLGDQLRVLLPRYRLQIMEMDNKICFHLQILRVPGRERMMLKSSLRESFAQKVEIDQIR